MGFSLPNYQRCRPEPTCVVLSYSSLLYVFYPWLSFDGWKTRVSSFFFFCFFHISWPRVKVFALGVLPGFFYQAGKCLLSVDQFSFLFFFLSLQLKTALCQWEWRTVEFLMKPSPRQHITVRPTFHTERDSTCYQTVENIVGLLNRTMPTNGFRFGNYLLILSFIRFLLCEGQPGVIDVMQQQFLHYHIG